jgi:hypothetical protein
MGMTLSCGISDSPFKTVAAVPGEVSASSGEAAVVRGECAREVDLDRFLVP